MAKYKYTLGAAGERLKIEENDRTVEYEYDELFRLTKETVKDENGTSITSYTYDKNSNRLTKTVDGEVTTYAYNELNQLISETGISYEYDLNGNLVKKTEGEQTTTYTYDARNKLIRVTIQSGQQVNVEEYLYDYAGNRIAKVQELKTTYYLVDTNGALSQVLAEYDDSSLITLYTRGEELISQERNGEKSYYLYDGFDSVRMLTDSEGVVTDTYTFDAFGNLVSSTGDTENSYLYRGEQYDSFTGLYYLRARYMNPTTGTFISMDEYVGNNFEPMSLHKYLYANANPIMNSDPTGYYNLPDLSAACTGISNLANTVVANSVAMLRNVMSLLRQTIILTVLVVPIFAPFSEDLYNLCEGLLDGTVCSTYISDDVKEQLGDLKDTKPSSPNGGRVYQLAYVSSYGGLMRLYHKYTFSEALTLLGITGVVNATKRAIYTYNRGKSSEAQRQLEHLGSGDWGIYTHYQADAKALALALGSTNPPEVHGPGMYGHYHDSTHTFHIWYGGQIN